MVAGGVPSMSVILLGCRPYHNRCCAGLGLAVEGHRAAGTTGPRLTSLASGCLRVFRRAQNHASL